MRVLSVGRTARSAPGSFADSSSRPPGDREGRTVSGLMLQARGLCKSFTAGRTKVRAVDGIDLDVERGEIFGFLGPNGAGKTTSLRMLSTLLPIDRGDATVAGYDVNKEPAEVRKRIGYVSQLGGADDEATGLEDLILQGQLYGMSSATARDRASELARLLELSGFAHRKVKTYSGGQKRRLDVALGIMHRPSVLFLDEPTIGLDPQNRSNLWDEVHSLRDAGTTIFLTTHYLEEADVLSDRVAIIDHGKIVAQGTPRDLKSKVAGDAIVIAPRVGVSVLQETSKFLGEQPFVREARVENEAIRLYVDDGRQALPQIFSLLEGRKVDIETMSLSEPSLDDVFLRQTGRSLRDADAKKVSA
jgi:ABC-2 type transport system ATP-binding protein